MNHTRVTNESAKNSNLVRSIDRSECPKNSLLNSVCSSIGLAMVFLFVILFTFGMSESLKYRAKFVFYILASAVAAGMWIPLMLFRIRSYKNAILPAYGAVIIRKMLGINYQLRGKENIVKDTGCVVLLNHQSSLDLSVLAELWLIMDHCSVIAKKEVMYLGVFGLSSWLWGTVFINRRNVEESHQILNATVESIRSAKRRLLLFPEGSRHSNKTLLPFKKGAFHVAIDSQMPIQPVVVSKYYFLNDKRGLCILGNSYITILPPIPTAGMTKDDLPKLMEQVYAIMNKTFVESTHECLADHIGSLKEE
ncbi:1-acyl-sn-glycerol-3-phosphate acyltransferase alpha isoform X2 [Odontomachus brunneus]|uniref:1-acyl-sn-glycerol-3-phosphate acyltransferase alpha isoform X2 n=1 Tax=Odontomachus brunneus TaxID=486640 RepID=UPI0013F27C46|nr:1-acyl-sn-glycerol-3-phosphate acyltransferase alpha isoform X2 [Odontomachus brunneus]